MKTKCLVVLVASLFAGSALASSPFMVEHSVAEAGSGGQAPSSNSSGKSTTLAESLVQLRVCSDDNSVNKRVTEKQNQSDNITTSQPPQH